MPALRFAPPTMLLLLLLLPALGPAAARADPDKRPFEEQPYLGLSVRDGPQNTLVVGWVLPGPLSGQGEDGGLDLRRDDNVVQVDGELRCASDFRAYVASKNPGDEITLVVRRSASANPNKAVPSGGPGGEERTLKVTLARRSDWAGTLARGLRKGVTMPDPGEGAFEALILAAAGELGLREGDAPVGGGLDALLARLKVVQEEALDVNSLPWVVNAFRRPLSLDRLEDELAGHIRKLVDPRASVLGAVLRDVLALPPMHWPWIADRSELNTELQRQEAANGGAGRRQALMQLVRTLRDDVTPFGPHAAQHIRLLGVEHGPAAADSLAGIVRILTMAPERWESEGQAHAQDAPLAILPDALRGAVEGDVLWAGEDGLGRHVVVGGPGPNRYDMSRISAVYDVDGDDVYDYGGEAHAPLVLVIDLAGNDLHASTTDFQGPGTSVLGLSWLEDRGGNDIYRSTGQGGMAVGIGGLGILIDHSGDDVYENLGPNAGWSMGVGFYGAGLLLDLKGNDAYRGEKLCQGVGGPLGLGLILDAQGNDRYDADGPSFPSAYGTPGVHVGMSQGFGYGVRGYAAGGVGAIYDLAGDDRYTAGEFSQAGGYFFGLGVLHDSSGNDLYHGNRYGQAFAAHQAVGILVDDAGDDTYWSMTAASQAGTWDESIGLLLDKQGNDSYRCDGLGQGAAAMQAIALLIDLKGQDRYTGRGKSVQGQGGGNSYHYDADKVFSFSALLDLGGSQDTYSGGRANGSTVRTGTLNETSPADSDLYGLFLDR